ncbi:MAG: hypothetical protein B7Y73_08230 [Acidocella sp. 35-58-6]|nr:MAG: hypothetical protein B7Y73_08230 [Acidocella sp. 35-58-6]
MARAEHAYVNRPRFVIPRIIEGPVILITPVHTNIFVEIPKYPTCVRLVTKACHDDNFSFASDMWQID